MTLHIFNPEHDIALASGLANFTAPHAGRQLRHDLGYMPALWASDGDALLTDDAEQARSRLSRWPQASAVDIVGRDQLSQLAIDRIEPWGWNIALRAYLLRHGVSERLMPTEAGLAEARQLSHRRQAAVLQKELRLKCGVERTTGEAYECRSEEEVMQLLQQYGRIVLKAPWSSSGRGLRFLKSEGMDDMTADGVAGLQPMNMQLKGWFRNVVAAQGSVMAEPYYPKVKDFGMEFFSDGDGRVVFLGLSLFHTENGAYSGNIVATEAMKREQLCYYVADSLLTEVQKRLCQLLGKMLCGKYRGPLGVDMMVVAGTNGGFLLHPCVEINLRRTMGHVAIALFQRLNPTNDDDVRHVMRIEYTEQNYKLKIYKK